MNKFLEEDLTGVTFILMRSNGNILLQLRDEKSKFYPNMWCFPGEGKEGNEELIQTVFRGAEEEYGISLKKAVCHFLMVNQLPVLSQNVAVFVCNLDPNQIPVLREGKEMRWVTMDELKKMKLGFEHKNILPVLQNYLKNIAKT